MSFGVTIRRNTVPLRRRRRQIRSAGSSLPPNATPYHRVRGVWDMPSGFMRFSCALHLLYEYNGSELGDRESGRARVRRMGLRPFPCRSLLRSHRSRFLHPLGTDCSAAIKLKPPTLHRSSTPNLSFLSLESRHYPVSCLEHHPRWRMCAVLLAPSHHFPVSWFMIRRDESQPDHLTFHIASQGFGYDLLLPELSWRPDIRVMSRLVSPASACLPPFPGGTGRLSVHGQKQCPTSNAASPALRHAELYVLHWAIHIKETNLQLPHPLARHRVPNSRRVKMMDHGVLLRVEADVPKKGETTDVWMVPDYLYHFPDRLTTGVFLVISVAEQKLPPVVKTPRHSRCTASSRRPTGQGQPKDDRTPALHHVRNQASSPSGPAQRHGHATWFAHNVGAVATGRESKRDGRGMRDMCLDSLSSIKKKVRWHSTTQPENLEQDRSRSLRVVARDERKGAEPTTSGNILTNAYCSERHDATQLPSQPTNRFKV
ncbi:hypothetical protein CSOJ01_04477 [Colletotrichum sojae]|uniref:Uncharacterized protein n=1 Tax=Colletotrichum sojae TaxID=2175907 RepID=A0A8H6MZA9_9PEZI|nr:hypothetical protein CSOJ01_04477 [Colletotrichum sojae]